MQKQIIVIALVIFSVVAARGAFADSISVQPSDHDLGDLDHGKAYLWTFDIDLQEDEVIIGASIFFDDIRNNDWASNDLYVTLIDDTWYDNYLKVYTDYYYGDYFTGWGTQIAHYEDLPAYSQDITYTFSADEIALLNAFAADGEIALGFDPDCHFYNDGVTFTYETYTPSGNIPEPASLAMIAAAAVSTGAFVRLRRRTK